MQSTPGHMAHQGLRANELIHMTPVLLVIFPMWDPAGGRVNQEPPRWIPARTQKAHAARMVRDDMERAGLHAFKPSEGTVDFHALRTTYVTLLDMNGASAKEAQDLARHSTPVITLNSYVRSTDDRKRQVVESVGALLHAPAPTQQEPSGQKGHGGETHTARESSAL